jgi:hypothetical protein
VTQQPHQLTAFTIDEHQVLISLGPHSKMFNKFKRGMYRHRLLSAMNGKMRHSLSHSARAPIPGSNNTSSYFKALAVSSSTRYNCNSDILLAIVSERACVWYVAESVIEALHLRVSVQKSMGANTAFDTLLCTDSASKLTTFIYIHVGLMRRAAPSLVARGANNLYM